MDIYHLLERGSLEKTVSKIAKLLQLEYPCLNDSNTDGIFFQISTHKPVIHHNHWYCNINDEYCYN